MSGIRKFQEIRDWLKQQQHNNSEDSAPKANTLKIMEGIGVLSRELTRKTETTDISLTELRKANISHTLGIISHYYASLLNSTDATPPPDSLTLDYEGANNTLGAHLSAILDKLSYLAHCNFETKDQFDRATIGEILRPLNQLSHHLTSLPLLYHTETSWESIIKSSDWLKNQTAATTSECYPFTHP